MISATAQLPADFTKILGYDMFNVNAQSTPKWGICRLRVALVLDNTGSMADQQQDCPALQSATQALLTQLQGAIDDSRRRLQPSPIVPFVKDVNVGATAYNSTWIYWERRRSQDPGLTDNAS